MRKFTIGLYTLKFTTHGGRCYADVITNDLLASSGISGTPANVFETLVDEIERLRSASGDAVDKAASAILERLNEQIAAATFPLFEELLAAVGGGGKPCRSVDDARAAAAAIKDQIARHRSDRESDYQMYVQARNKADRETRRADKAEAELAEQRRLTEYTVRERNAARAEVEAARAEGVKQKRPRFEVVKAGEVGDRPRWFVFAAERGQEMADKMEQGLGRNYLHRGDGNASAVFAVVDNGEDR